MFKFHFGGNCPKAFTVLEIGISNISYVGLKSERHEKYDQWRKWKTVSQRNEDENYVRESN